MPSIDNQQIISAMGWVIAGLSAIVATIIAFMFKREIKKIENMQAEILKLKIEIVLIRSDIDAARDEFRTEHEKTRTIIIDSILKSKQ